jgi:leader peptidase (prepilin peptidase)/N-methyltransferase
MSVLFWFTWAALGACVGSFLNVCILRWPADESVVSPRSRCPRCQRMIRWYENIPIVSWILLRAKCAGCGLPISARYPAIEFIIALGWLAAGLAYGPGLTSIRVAVFGTILFGIAVTDLEKYLIPDGFTVTGLVFTIVTAFAGLFVSEWSPFAGPVDAIVGACAGAGAIAIIGWLGEVALKREAMGFGDVTLMAFAGAALGPYKSLLTIFVGAALGAVIFLLIVIPVVKLRGAKAPAATPAPAAATAAESATGDAPESNTDDNGLPLVPFGVFLAPAALVVLLWGDALVAWYLRTVMT